MEDSGHELKRKRPHKPIQPPSPSPENERKRTNSDKEKQNQIRRDSVFRRLGVPRDNKKPQRKLPDVCRHWKQRGKCDFGNDCCFDHPQNLARHENNNPAKILPSRWLSPGSTRPLPFSGPPSSGPPEPSGPPASSQQAKRPEKELPRAYATTREFDGDRLSSKRCDTTDRSVKYDNSPKFKRQDKSNNVRNNDETFERSAPRKASQQQKSEQKPSYTLSRLREERKDETSRLRSLVVISRNASISDKSRDKYQSKKERSSTPYDKRNVRIPSRNSSPKRQQRQRDRTDTPSSTSRYESKSARELEKQRDMIKRSLQLLDTRKNNRPTAFTNRPSNTRERKFVSPNKNRTSLYGRDLSNQNRLPNRGKNESNISDLRRDRTRFTNWRSSLLNNNNNNRQRNVDESRKSPNIDRHLPPPRTPLFKNRRPLVATRFQQQQAVQKRRVNRLFVRRTGNVLTSANTVPLATRRMPQTTKPIRNDRRIDRASNKPSFTNARNVSSYDTAVKSLSDRNADKNERKSSRSLNNSMDSSKDHPPKKKPKLDKERLSPKDKRPPDDFAKAFSKPKSSNSTDHRVYRKQNRKSEERKPAETMTQEMDKEKDMDKRSNSVASEKKIPYSDSGRKKKKEEEIARLPETNTTGEQKPDKRKEKSYRGDKTSKNEFKENKESILSIDHKSQQISENNQSNENIDVPSSAEQELEPISDEETQDEQPVPAVTTQTLRVDWSILAQEKNQVDETDQSEMGDNTRNQLESVDEEGKDQSKPPSALDRFKLQNLLPRLCLNANLLGYSLTKQLESAVNKNRREKDIWRIAQNPIKGQNANIASILNNVGPYRKALSARFELNVRRKLCGLHEEPPQHLLMNASEVGAPFNEEIYNTAKNLANKSRKVVT